MMMIRMPHAMVQRNGDIEENRGGRASFTWYRWYLAKAKAFQAYFESLRVGTSDEDLWSDGTGTLLEVVNRPPLFKSFSAPHRRHNMNSYSPLQKVQ
jgi:hypothetical protein